MFALTQVKDIVFFVFGVDLHTIVSAAKDMRSSHGRRSTLSKKDMDLKHTIWARAANDMHRHQNKKRLAFAKPRTVAKIIVAKVAWQCLRAVKDMHRLEKNKKRGLSTLPRGCA